MEILIKNGHIWDGHRFFDGDIRIKDGLIAEISPGIDGKFHFTYDAAGKLVTPGLVDIHMHMRGLSGPEYDIPAEAACFPFGVTAAADAGARLGSPEIMAQIAVKNTVFAATRVVDNHLDAEITEKRLRQYNGQALGVKLFFDETSPHVKDIGLLQEVCTFARQQGVKVMVHCNHSPCSMLQIVETLAPGDILSHIYHGGKNTCLEDDFAALKLARQKGVIMDAAFAGHVHTDFGVLQTAIRAGFTPDTISTDITKASAFMRGGRYGMTMCMSMARTAGMEEADILRCVTVNPAKALGKDWGTLEVGKAADLAVLEYADEGFSLRGGYESKNGYRCCLTVADGIIVHRN